MLPDRLSTYPFGRVRIRCPFCQRRGDYALARLAVRFGPEAPLRLVLFELTRSCKWQRPPGIRLRPYQPFCGARFVDLPDDDPPPPPALRLVG